MKKVASNGKGILLDIGLTDQVQKNFIRMGKGIQHMPPWSVEHDLETFPWPLEDNVCLMILAAHVIEHIKPWLVVPFMDELWRVMKPDGQLAIATAYASSPTWYQDPTHCSHFTEASFLYFDPNFPEVYKIHTPKPWKIEKGNPMWSTNGNIECVMRAVK